MAFAALLLGVVAIILLAAWLGAGCKENEVHAQNSVGFDP